MTCNEIFIMLTAEYQFLPNHKIQSMSLYFMWTIVTCIFQLIKFKKSKSWHEVKKEMKSQINLIARKAVWNK